MGMFQFSISQGQITQRTPKLQGGFTGVVQIVRTEISRTRQGDKFFANFIIVQTNDEAKHPVGKMLGWGQLLTDPNIAAGAMKEFVAAVWGVDPNDEQQVKTLEPYMDQIMAAAVNAPDNNQLCGRNVKVETYEKKTNNNRDFTTHRWAPYK